MLTNFYSCFVHSPLQLQHFLDWFLDNDCHKHDLPICAGGIDPGEEAQAAAIRELEEETSMRSVRVLTCLDRWLKYNFSPEVSQNLRLNVCVCLRCEYAFMYVYSSALIVLLHFNNCVVHRVCVRACVCVHLCARCVCAFVCTCTMLGCLGMLYCVFSGALSLNMQKYAMPDTPIFLSTSTG